MTLKRGETRRVRLFSLISLLAQSFSRMKAPARGLISLFSHKVHSFSGDAATGEAFSYLAAGGLFVRGLFVRTGLEL